MGSYSIKELEQISGIKAHTIRIWEQRFGILNPQRTETNIRFYDENDLKLLLNISMLTCKGVKISTIANMTTDEITQFVSDSVESCQEYANQVNSLLISTIELDEPKFDKIFSTCAQRFGFERTILNVIYPLFSRVGIFWQTGTLNAAQEHFLSNLVRQKLITAIDNIDKIPAANADKCLVFLPEGELHEIPLLFATWHLKIKGLKVIYLGQSVPIKDLLSVYKIHKPEFLFTVLTSKIGKDCPEDLAKEICDQIPDSTLLITGSVVIHSNCTMPANCKILVTVENLDYILNLRKLN